MDIFVEFYVQVCMSRLLADFERALIWRDDPEKRPRYAVNSREVSLEFLFLKLLFIF